MEDTHKSPNASPGKPQHCSSQQRLWQCSSCAIPAGQPHQHVCDATASSGKFTMAKPQPSSHPSSHAGGSSTAAGIQAVPKGGLSLPSGSLPESRALGLHGCWERCWLDISIPHGTAALPDQEQPTQPGGGKHPALLLPPGQGAGPRAKALPRSHSQIDEPQGAITSHHLSFNNRALTAAIKSPLPHHPVQSLLEKHV